MIGGLLPGGLGALPRGRRRGLSILPAGAKVAFVGHSFIGRTGFGTVTDVTNVNPRRDIGQGLTRGAFGWMQTLDTDRRFNIDHWLWYPATDRGNLTDAYVDGAYQGVSGDHLVANGALPGVTPRLTRVLGTLNPDVVVMDAGINDANSSVSDSATLISRLDTAIAAITNAGKRCFAFTLTDRWPSGAASWPNGDARIGYIDDANAWLVAQDGRAGGRFRVVDLRALGFNRTGALGWDSSLFGTDGIHPNPKGGRLMADQLLPALRSMVSAGTPFDGDAAAGNLWPNAGLLGTAGTKTGTTVPTGNVASNWNVNMQAGTSTVVCSKEVIDASFEKQVLTITPVNDATAVHTLYLRNAANPTLASMGLASGDWFEMWLYAELSANANWRNVPLVGEIYNVGTGVLFANGGLGNADTSTQDLPLSAGFSGWIRLTAQQVPAWNAVDNFRLSQRPIQLSWLRTATGPLVAKFSKPIIRKVASPLTAWGL